MRIVALDGYTMNPGDNPWTEVEALGELEVHPRSSLDEIVERAAGAAVIITNKAPLSAETLAKLPDLKLITVTATGYNVVDVKAARERGIPVSNIPEYGTATVAQFVFGLILELVNRVGEHDVSVHAGEWVSSPDWCYWKRPQIELDGLTLGVVGFGRIGRRVADIGRAFGMRILAHSRSRKDTPGYEGFEWAESIEDLFSRADVVTLHCPQTAENAGMVNKALLGKMRPGALFVNTARGTLVNEADLAEALNSGRLAAAAVDVVSREPVVAENPLLGAKNLIITPHIAWAALAARERLMHETAENIKAFQAGTPRNVVN